MESLLSSEDRNYILEFLRRQRRGVRSLTFSANILLVAGGLAIIMAALFLLQHRTDEAVLYVGLPNLVGGMVCFVAYLILSRKIEEMRKAISILSKFMGLS